MPLAALALFRRCNNPEESISLLGFDCIGVSGFVADNKNAPFSAKNGALIQLSRVGGCSFLDGWVALHTVKEPRKPTKARPSGK
jgi:hypothetical protein